jgi:hypothetical protein
MARAEAALFDRMPGITHASIMQRSVTASMTRLLLGGVGSFALAALVIWAVPILFPSRLYLQADVGLLVVGGIGLHLLVAIGAHPLDLRRWKIFETAFWIAPLAAYVGSFVLALSTPGHEISFTGPLMVSGLAIAPWVGLLCVYLKDRGNKEAVVESFADWQASRQSAAQNRPPA